MKSILKLLTALLFGAIIFSTSNCAYKNVQEIYPLDTSGCKTDNMSYANDIAPILRANHCYTCHGDARDSNVSGQGIVLEGYVNLLQNGVPGDIIFSDISAPDGTISHMPGGYPDVSPCDIAKIKAWLDQGHKNN